MLKDCNGNLLIPETRQAVRDTLFKSGSVYNSDGSLYIFYNKSFYSEIYISLNQEPVGTWDSDQIDQAIKCFMYTYEANK